MENIFTIEFWKNIIFNVDIIKTIIMFILTYYTNYKITNKKMTFNSRNSALIVLIIVNSVICGLVRYKNNYFISMIYLIVMISIIFNNDNLKDSIVATVISLSINLIINLISIIISYIILGIVIKSENDYVDTIVIAFIRLILLILIFKIKKFKYGFTYFINNKKNPGIDIFILNISIIILFSVIIFESSNKKVSKANIGMEIILLIIISIISLKKSLQIYYKEKLLIQDLNETKKELNCKKEENSKLEAENLNFSKKSHSLAHKQKAMEYKLNQLMLKYETAEEIDIKERLESISKELYENTSSVELTKTDIPEIDDMLKFMQSECEKNKIDFNLQISGNIYHMINNIISKEELEILLADHIKDAIIAIKHTDNVNKSILVKLGKIEECYGLYIYDSGIEFEKETLENLGKKPSTTHADEGGTGMGFMNTFDTLRKHNASLIINEIGMPTKENYTKVIMIKFDNKNEFKVISYRN